MPLTASKATQLAENLGPNFENSAIKTNQIVGSPVQYEVSFNTLSINTKQFWQLGALIGGEEPLDINIKRSGTGVSVKIK